MDYQNTNIEERKAPYTKKIQKKIKIQLSNIIIQIWQNFKKKTIQQNFIINQI